MVVTDPRRPTQVLWGRDDPALRLERAGAIARALVGEERFATVRGRHFFPDDQHAPVAAHVARFVASIPPA